jgi:hypothetical protein
MTSPVFIVGANRSGTTLLRLILNAHSRIAIPEELNYFYAHMAGVPITRWRGHTISPQFVDRIIDKNCHPLAELGLDIEHLRKEIKLHSPLTLREPYRMILEAWARREDKPRWGEKTPANLYYADVLIDMFPEARFIHIVRDPRGGVASMQRVHFYPNDVVFNALARHRAMTSGREILESNVPTNQRLTIRYEDLVADPDTVVPQICTFIDESYEPAMLDFHRSSERYMKKSAATGFNANATKPISEDVAQKWKRRLSEDQVAVIEHVCMSHMQLFGYEKVGARLSSRRAVELLIKRAYWRWKCWENRENRHYTVKSPMFARTRKKLRLD